MIKVACCFRVCAQSSPQCVCVCSSKVKLGGDDTVDDQSASSLLQGEFADTSAPAVPMISDDAQMKLAKIMNPGKLVRKPSQKQLQPKPMAEEMEPVSPLEKAKGQLQKGLEQRSQELRQLVCRWRACRIAMSSWRRLDRHIKDLEKAFRHIKHHIGKATNTESTYNVAYSLADPAITWWATSGEKACAAFVLALVPSLIVFFCLFIILQCGLRLLLVKGQS